MDILSCALIAALTCYNFYDHGYRKNNYVRMKFKDAKEEIFVFFKAKDEDFIDRLTIKIDDKTYINGTLDEFASDGNIRIENKKDLKRVNGLVGYFGLSAQELYSLQIGEHEVRITIEDKKGNLRSAIGSITITPPYKKQQNECVLI